MSLLTNINFPNGALYNSSQVLLGAGTLFTTGTVFFVNSVTGSDDNNGTDPSTPKATVQGAISACTANKGDKIICMPGHASTVTSTSINLSKAGVSVICLGTGLERPTFTYGAAAATITVSAANCAFLGGHFIGNFLDVASAFTVGAAKDFQLIGNTFSENSASLGFLSIVVTGSTANAADGLTIVGNKWKSLDVSANAFISVLGTLDRFICEDNDVVMDATNDVGHFMTMSSLNVTNAVIRRNTLYVTGSTGATVGIFMTGSGTAQSGTMANNTATSLDATTELFLTATITFGLFDNKYTGAKTASGYVLPAIDA